MSARRRLRGCLAVMSDTPQPAAPTTEVTVWSLEQTSPDDLRPASTPEGDVRVVRSEVPSPSSAGSSTPPWAGTSGGPTGWA